MKPLKENCWKAFSKESELIRVARQAYYKTHQPNYEQEGWYDLSSTFWEMAASANLMGTEVCKVQEAWTSLKDLRVVHHVAKTSPKDICFFRIVLPTKSPKIMCLRGIHSPKVLQWQGGLSFCPWCGKEGQNEGTVENHLQTTHYHLGLICSHCMIILPWAWMPCTSTPSFVSWQWPASMTMMTGGKFEDDDNSGKYDDKFAFDED